MHEIGGASRTKQIFSRIYSLAKDIFETDWRLQIPHLQIMLAKICRHHLTALVWAITEGPSCS